MFKIIILFWVISSTSGELYPRIQGEKLNTSKCTPTAHEGKNFENFKNIGGLIVGGQPAKIEDIPYQAAIYYRDYYFCSGCVVTSNYIVSAAHCLWYFTRDTRGLTVRVGSDQMQSGGQVIKVKRVVLHPKFSLKTVDYDASVAELATPLKFSEWIKPIKLAASIPRDGQKVKVSGWGYLKEKGPPSRVLQCVVVKVVNREVCEKVYKNRIRITKRMLCACVEGKDACYGDSGGPLATKEGLVGIVSMGEGCARINSPGVYTNIGNPEIKDFIIQETGL